MRKISLNTYCFFAVGVMCLFGIGQAMAQSQAEMPYPGEERAHYIGNASSFYPRFDIGSTAPAEVTQDIETLVQDFASRWRGKTWTTITELWDKNEEAPYLLLAHQPDWLVGWEELNNYFSIDQKTPIKQIPDEAAAGIQQIESRHYEYRAEKDLQEMLYKADRIRVRLIDENLAVAVWYVDFQYKPFFMQAKGEHFKANAMFRKTPDGWKFIHYGEAPMSAIMYMERLYRSQVSQEFLDLLEQK
jgi:hypothetical protein